MAIVYDLNIMQRPSLAKQLAGLHKFVNKLLKSRIIREVCVIRTKACNDDLCLGFPILIVRVRQKKPHPPRPAFPYPQSKVEAEEALLQLHREQGLGLRIVRLPFVYGDGDPHIAEFMPFASKWHPAKRMHMAHHADVSQALLLAASTPGIDGRIYNVGDDAPISVAELLQLNNSDSEISSEEQDFDPWDMVVDTTRIRNELNYRPIFPSFYTARDAGAL
ncbi:NAD(P)-dependent oxidoreductase [Paenibacillus sp. 19GGS1-52]|uniref:NAD-dependent epimerase/dehydratase family protein n=1 Tax=Paenibacillus sp. 19GGS1-52 TaxID=2758563 RepID=UPI001EFC255E|nr:NAD(P)-dependent oxidoreductase [Paenibacillus sp. 19GGS1-52]